MNHFFGLLFARVKSFARQVVASLLENIRPLPGAAMGISFLIYFLSRFWAGYFLHIFWDGNGWIRWEPRVRLPLGPHLPLGKNWLRGLEPNGEEVFRPRRKWWFRHYHPSRGDVILDVGAGMGEDTWVFSVAVGCEGKVLAFEAHPTTYRYLEAFASYNHLRNASLLFGAICRGSGKTWISTGQQEQWQANSLVSQNSERPTNGYEISCYRLDEIPLARELPKINFIKMNIEGAEVSALLGAKECLQKTENVCICCHDFLGPAQATKKRVCALLRQAGFTLFFSDPGSPPYERDFVYGKRK